MTAKKVDHEAAWHRFWQPGRAHAGGGCMPARWAPIEEAQRATWTRFAEHFPDGARVLDLATGDGRVLAMLKQARSDIEAIGVDFAPQLPPPPPGTTIRGGVRMEAVPFDDGSFDAVTSQFGFEYGEVETIAQEIARLLRRGGRVGLLVHRGDGPILAHNAARAEQIDYVLKDFDIVREDLSPEALPKTMAEAEGRVRRAIEQFGQASVGWEISEALRRSVLLVQRLNADEAWIAIRNIVNEAGGERARIASLADACATADDHERLDSAFAEAGLRSVSRAPVVANGSAIADFISLTRS